MDIARIGILLFILLAICYLYTSKVKNEQIKKTNHMSPESSNNSVDPKTSIPIIPSSFNPSNPSTFNHDITSTSKSGLNPPYPTYQVVNQSTITNQAIPDNLSTECKDKINQELAINYQPKNLIQAVYSPNTIDNVYASNQKDESQQDADFGSEQTNLTKFFQLNPDLLVNQNSFPIMNVLR